MRTPHVASITLAILLGGCYIQPQPAPAPQPTGAATSPNPSTAPAFYPDGTSTDNEYTLIVQSNAALQLSVVANSSVLPNCGMHVQAGGRDDCSFVSVSRALRISLTGQIQGPNGWLPINPCSMGMPGGPSLLMSLGRWDGSIGRWRDQGLRREQISGGTCIFVQTGDLN